MNVKSGAVSADLKCSTRLIGIVRLVIFCQRIILFAIVFIGSIIVAGKVWNMADVPDIIQLLRRSGPNEIAVLLTCVLLTVIFDMVIAITVGVLLASLLFIRTIAEMTKSIFEIAHPEDLQMCWFIA